MPSLRLTAVLPDGERRLDVRPDYAVIAGWTGRDRAAMEHHIAELEALGVKRPKATPTFYRVAASRLTTAPRIEATGETSSGEVEFVLIQIGGELWIGLGSDHTDRKVETYSVTVSKQMCDKPLAPRVWRYRDLAGHWDELELRSWITENGAEVAYQEGSVAAMLAPETLIERYCGGTALPEGTVMFGGTLTAKGGVRPAARFRMELSDPLLGRSLGHAYEARALPDEG
ncbi:MAG: DUF2848 domain-containing protein [Kiloniellales bacterium]